MLRLLQALQLLLAQPDSDTQKLIPVPLLPGKPFCRVATALPTTTKWGWSTMTFIIGQNLRMSFSMIFLMVPRHTRHGWDSASIMPTQTAFGSPTLILKTLEYSI